MSATKDPFLLVVNPCAGAGRAEKNFPRLASALREAGASFDVARTERTGHATEIVRGALRAGTRGIAVVGGDGTLNEAVNGFFEPDGSPIAEGAWLGPLSIGTGGDFRKTIGAPSVGARGRGIEALVTRMLWAKPRAIDVGWIDFMDHSGAEASRAFLNIASVGAEGLVDQLVGETKWMGGFPGFLVGTVRGLARYKPQRVRITLDGGTPRQTRIINLAIANGRYFGGGMKVAPRAEIDDGLFEVIGLEMSQLEVFGLSAAIYLGTHVGRQGVTASRAKLVRAEAAEPREHVLIGVDGEPPGRLPATFRVKPGALQLRG